LGVRTAFLRKYRFYGVDTPEMNDPDPAVRERAVRSKEFVQAAAGGKEVVLSGRVPCRQVRAVAAVDPPQGSGGNLAPRSGDLWPKARPP